MESSWDRFGRTTDQKWEDYTSTVTTVDHVSYEYDYAGNRTKRLPKAQSFAGPKQNFEYDGLHRLKLLATTSAFNANNLRQEWTLDQLGNWTTFKHDLDADGDYSDPGDLNQTRTHNDVNEIGTISGWFNPTYDAAGNMTTIPSPHATSGAFTVTYDAWNRVVRVENNTSTTQTNEYDGLNRRIVKIDKAASPDVTYNYYYNQQWQVVEIRKDGDTDPWKQYVYHPHYVDAIALRRFDENTDGNILDANEGEHYYLQDANFNVTAVVESDGTVAERYHYTPYGEVTIMDSQHATRNSSLISNEYLYTGRRLDAETGLQLNRNRFYASHLGRWVNRDPIGYDAGTANLYGYVEGRPTRFVDPLGLAFTDPGPGGDPINPVPGLNPERFPKYPDPEPDPLELGGLRGKATCTKGPPYKCKKSGEDKCDYTCQCPPGYHPGFQSMTHNGWPCDQAPEIYCVKNRNWWREGIEAIIGIGIISGTLVEDVATCGGGIVDDPPSIAAGIILICPSPRPEPIGPGPNPSDDCGCDPNGNGGTGGAGGGGGLGEGFNGGGFF